MKPVSSPSPELFFDTAFAFQRSAAIKAAIDLDVFTAISQGHQTSTAIASQSEAAERGIRMLVDYLVILGFLMKNGNNYFLTEDSKMFLVKGSPAYVGSTLEFIQSPPLFDGFRHLTEAVRRGGTALDEKGTTANGHPEWVNFAKAMVPMMIGPAKWIAEYLISTGKPVNRVLDIAAGHGMFGVEIAKRFPDAEIVAVDWANVLTVAHDNAQAAALGSRYRTIPGSAFEVDYGQGYDLALLTNFLHHFDQPTCEALLKKIHASLEPHGRIITLEFVPNDDRISPASAGFPLIMLATTPAGDAYTFKELDAMFRHSGFGKSEIYPAPNSNEHVLVTCKG